MDNEKFYKKLQSDAKEIIEKAAKVLRLHEDSFRIVNQKDEGDIATSADIASETLIIEEIKKRYPTHGIYSEERGNIPGKEPFTWIIDPLDQTKEYTRHAGEYNCLIAIEHEDNVVVGVTKRIGMNELYSCSRGNGAYMNGKPIHVSKTSDIDKSFVSCYLPNKKFKESDIQKDLTILSALIHHTYRTRGNNDEAKGLAWTAKGTYDAHVFVPDGGEWYDIASGLLIVQEAGGTVTDWNGKTISNRDISHGILASNGIIHKQLLEIINT